MEVDNADDTSCACVRVRRKEVDGQKDVLFSL